MSEQLLRGRVVACGSDYRGAPVYTAKPCEAADDELFAGGRRPRIGDVVLWERGETVKTVESLGTLYYILPAREVLSRADSAGSEE